jgi:mono/diheme cytochrome c family protein
MLAAAATRAGDAAAIEQIITAATDMRSSTPLRGDPDRTDALRLALLSGVETGLSASNEMASGNRGAVPAAATGRAAIAGGAVGGALAPTPRASATAPKQPLLSAEPIALATLAAGAGETADLARQILARVTWPGKPAPVGPVVPPLNAADQARFAAGAEIYQNICINCHQPDGRGKEHLAPALVGSKYALAMPAVPTRILLGGKEGTVGLMPPLAMLTDEQIAAVLTFVRREWGNTASPVNPAIVKDTRALTASHKRPWTDAELARFITVRPD